MRRILLFFAFGLGACGSSEPTPPAWTDAPASIETYEGRTVSVPFTVTGSDPAAVRVEATGDGVEVERDGATLRVRAAYGASPATVRIDLVEGAQRTTVNVALRAHRLSWKPMSWEPPAGPPALEHSVFFLDESAGAAYLLHGSGYSPQFIPVAERWRLDVASGAWSPWTPSGDVPPPSGAARGATVKGRGIGYVHGGYTMAGTTPQSEGDLYRVDLASGAFKRLSPSSQGPAPRELHALSYDPKGDRIVVFGGNASGAVLGDTWLAKVDGDNATWTSVTGEGPSPRYGSFYALDEASSRFVVWSGAQEGRGRDQVNAAQDAWALDLATDPPAWTKLEPTGEAPKGRRNGCTMHDPVGRRLFVYGGTSDALTSQEGLFVLDLEPGREAWTKLDLAGQPASRSSGFGFATKDGRVACGFGNGNRTPTHSGLHTDLNWIGYFD